jgi:hypothetical protein
MADNNHIYIPSTCDDAGKLFSFVGLASLQRNPVDLEYETLIDNSTINFTALMYWKGSDSVKWQLDNFNDCGKGWVDLKGKQGNSNGTQQLDDAFIQIQVSFKGIYDPTSPNMYVFLGELPWVEGSWSWSTGEGFLRCACFEVFVPLPCTFSIFNALQESIFYESWSSCMY